MERDTALSPPPPTKRKRDNDLLEEKHLDLNKETTSFVMSQSSQDTCSDRVDSEPPKSRDVWCEQYISASSKSKATAFAVAKDAVEHENNAKQLSAFTREVNLLRSQESKTALDLLDEVMRNYQRREGVSRRDAQVPLQLLRDKISIMEHDLKANCPKDIPAEARAWASGVDGACKQCGLHHFVVELHRIAVLVYGDSATVCAKRKERWTREGGEEYTTSIRNAMKGSWLASHLREMTSRVRVNRSDDRRYKAKVETSPDALVQSMLETMLYRMAPARYSFPQFMFSVLCSTKHVPQSIHLTQEIMGHRTPMTTTTRGLDILRESGVHELRVANLIRVHGKARSKLCFFRADNYQRLYNAVTSASSTNPNSDRSHVVITSAIKSGDNTPLSSDVMLRATLDTDIPDDITKTHQSYYVNIGDNLFVDGEPSGLKSVTDVRFTPEHGTYYDVSDFEPLTSPVPGDIPYTHTITVPIAREGCCKFGDPSPDLQTHLVKTLSENGLHYNKFMCDSAVVAFKPNDAAYQRVAKVHGTERLHCNLQNTTPLGAADLRPSSSVDMLVFLLHLYHLIITVNGPTALRYLWPITFDEDTYTRARRIIWWVTEAAPASGEFNGLSLPDFGIFFLAPEFWHVGYTLMKHLTFGPKLKKGADERDNKRFVYTNFLQPLLVIMRQRGSIRDDDLAARMQTYNSDAPVEFDSTLSIQKEKMGAEFRDCHLYLTYLRLSWEKWCKERPGEYIAATAAKESNLDLQAIFDLFESRLPLSLDFVEHVHFQNTSVLDYMIARIILMLDSEHRTGYRRVLLQFLQDILSMPDDRKELLMKNMNSLSAVDIELMHGMLSSVIPTVHRAKTEQAAINNACRNFSVLKVASAHNNSYHKHLRTFGYSTIHKLPKQSVAWINVAFKILVSKINQCIARPTTAASIKVGKVFSKGRVVISRNLGTYPIEYIESCTRIEDRVKTLITSLRTSNRNIIKEVIPEDIKSKLRVYCMRPSLMEFPFNDEALGLSLSKMKHV